MASLATTRINYVYIDSIFSCCCDSCDLGDKYSTHWYTLLDQIGQRDLDLLSYWEMQKVQEIKADRAKHSGWNATASKLYPQRLFVEKDHVKR